MFSGDSALGLRPLQAPGGGAGGLGSDPPPRGRGLWGGGGPLPGARQSQMWANKQDLGPRASGP